MFYEMHEKTVVISANQQGNKTGIIGFIILAILGFLQAIVFSSDFLNLFWTNFIFATISAQLD